MSCRVCGIPRESGSERRVYVCMYVCLYRCAHSFFSLVRASVDIYTCGQTDRHIDMCVARVSYNESFMRARRRRRSSRAHECSVGI